MKEKLWTKKYLFSLMFVFGVNMGYTLLNSVMAIYRTLLTSSSVMGVYMITVFTISALLARLFIKKLNEKYSNKVLLVFAMAMTVGAALGYCLVDEIVPFLVCRMVHGLGFGIGLTCATAISNEYVPASRLSEGVGFTSSANTIANAIGPTIALEILGEQYTNFLSLFVVLLVISTSVFFLSFFVQSHTKSERVVQKKQSYHGIVIAAVFLMATFSQGAVNSFLASYAKVLHFGNIGLFFTITAVVTFFSRFFSQKIQNYLGLRKAACILSAVMGICILLISFVTSEFQLFLLAVPYGLSTGMLFPIFNYRIIQTVDASQFAFATSIYYCALDIG